MRVDLHTGKWPPCLIARNLVHKLFIFHGIGLGHQPLGSWPSDCLIFSGQETVLPDFVELDLHLGPLKERTKY